MKKYLEEYAMVAEIISALAVVASLIFVGLEIRQSANETALNTAAIEVAAFYDLTDSISSNTLSRLQIPGFEELWRRALRGDPTLDEIEVFKYRAYLQIILRQSETAHMQFERGIIDEATLHSLLNPFRGNFGVSPIATSVWSDTKGNRRTEFEEYIEAYMKGRYTECDASLKMICDYWQSI